MFHISNVSGFTVEIPLATAKELFGRLNMDDIFNVARTGADADEPGDAPDVDDGATASLRADGLEYSNQVLQAVRDYATLPSDQRTANIERPLAHELENVVRPNELALVTEAERGEYLVDLQNCAMFLRFSQLSALCCAYMAVRIDEIAKNAPSIMDGAESIRKFLRMENEWTSEETEHLQREMEYAKSVDPHVY